MNGSIQTGTLNSLIEVVKAKRAHVLILMGPFVDSNNELISSGNIDYTFQDLLQKIIDDISNGLKTTQCQIIIQPSLLDLTQDPIYPISPFNVSSNKLQNQRLHFIPEPCMLHINEYTFAVTSTDVIKDLLMISHSKSSSSDKIYRNFVHLLKQRSFYPIYPPSDNICIDFEALNEYALIDELPKVFITASDLTTFNKVTLNEP
jgi:DNA polymerase alpha subunit B